MGTFNIDFNTNIYTFFFFKNKSNAKTSQSAFNVVLFAQ